MDQVIHVFYALSGFYFFTMLWGIILEERFPCWYNENFVTYTRITVCSICRQVAEIWRSWRFLGESEQLDREAGWDMLGRWWHSPSLGLTCTQGCPEPASVRARGRGGAQHKSTARLARVGSFATGGAQIGVSEWLSWSEIEGSEGVVVVHWEGESCGGWCQVAT